jgi:hypothetical protein
MQMIRLVSTVILLMITLSDGIGQSYKRHPFDFSKFNLGFLMGLNYNAYNLKEQVQIEERGILLERIQVLPRYGLSLGMISNYNLSDQFSLRFIPTISLEQRDFNYNFANDSLVVRKIEASYLNLPLMLQMKSKYWRSTRMYVLAGAQLGLNMGSNKKVRDDKNLLKITTHDASLVFGFGWNLYGDRIKLSPEIRYSMGLINIYRPEFTSHAAAIETLMSQVLMLVVNFE